MSRVIGRPSPRRDTIALAVAIAVLGAAFVWLPAALVGGATVSRAALHRSTADAVATYWHSGRAPWTGDLSDLVGRWRDYHLAKAVIAVVAVVVLARAAAVGRRRASTAGRPRWHALGPAAAGLGALVAVLLLVANVQGAFAPFASLLSLLPTTTADRSFAPTLGEIREALARRAVDGHGGPAPLERMIDAFVGYHVVLAVLAGALALVAAGSVARALVRRRRTVEPTATASGPSRLALGTTGLLCVAAGVLCLANVSTALRPVPALRDAFG